MKWLRRLLAAVGVLAAILLIAVVAVGFPPSWGAGAILHPARRAVGPPPALQHRDVTIESGDVTLKGWLFPARGAPRGITVVYLHGSADNRDSGNWIAERLVPKGFDVLAYDGRAHGDSTGGACTYGVLEKQDLRRALHQLGVRRAILIGGSLGAAVALQAAPDDPRIIAVVAASTFSDLETIARDRTPITMRDSQIRDAFSLVEAQAGFRVADASPLRAAGRIKVPVLIIHGADDVETSPEHSKRVYAALAGPKTLRIVEKAGHDGPLSMVWGEVEKWIEEVAVGGADPGAADSTTSAYTTADAAERTLLSARVFRGSVAGKGMTTPPEVRAFRVLLAAPDATARIRRVAADGSMAGRLYAACGLYFLDPVAFQSELVRLAGSRTDVETQSGCMMMTRTVMDVVAPVKGAPQLSPGGSYREWLRALRSVAVLDIPGGSRCYDLRYGTEAPARWLDDPSSAPELGPEELRRGGGR